MSDQHCAGAGRFFASAHVSDPALSELTAALTPSVPTLESVSELIACAERRLVRASERMERAQTEFSDAVEALTQARQAKEDWIAANPDPQIEFPFSTSLTGASHG